MTGLMEFMDKRYGWGDQGAVRILKDDGGPGGPGELEEEIYYNMMFLKKTEVVERILIGKGGKVVGREVVGRKSSME